ncbi:glycosyltransferase involved in cell wall biosynthesis [Rhodoblastus sphagnicola]|uniref:glycosyltransferase family 2 protein n=1 Tax=Rhodoblastus sphagnicola TaxID=333368 RepID=UPI001609931D|nr:glycosyltransferase [Rhodoblastus sphagnicola]MBB4200559.1 glycosyltransferase involved in cell wall biosynthesis [Rhodoblastus sphagnicola]
MALQPSISIVMPSYNGSAYIHQAIDSVLAQSLNDWELIISDDCSTDDTASYLQSINHPRIKIYSQPSNRGIFDNLNFLFSKAIAPITQILCQDDTFTDSNSLKTILYMWRERDSHLAFIRSNHGDDQTKSKLNRFERDVIPMLPRVVRPQQSDILFFIFGCIPGNLSNVSMRTSLVAEIGGFNQSLPYAGDFEFWTRLGRLHPWAISATKVVNVRAHAKQASNTLNFKGELVPQLALIIDTLYYNLVSAGVNKSALRLLATLTYVSRQRDAAIRRILSGRGSLYLNIVEHAFCNRAFSLRKDIGWLLYFASIGGRTLAVEASKILINTKAVRRILSE